MRIGTISDGPFYEDLGSGIPKDEQEKVFRSGFSTKEDGAGFGIVSVKQIALAHGWDISVKESTPRGARFEFRDVQEPK
jgi:signal transduction histidine kinase